jgi:putative transposase
MVYHVLNRRVDRQPIFERDSDYEAFEKVMEETLQICPMRICSYSLMPNHWHMVLWPERNEDLSKFMHQLTVTHTVRWKKKHDLVGSGHLYQNRFKSFPVEIDTSFEDVVRYVERNALTANLVQRAEDWRWSSLWRRMHEDEYAVNILSEWPVEYPSNWLEYVNKPISDKELQMIRSCVQRGKPLGSDVWVQLAAQALHLESTMRKRGRPLKKGTDLQKTAL